jgi:hypothetical protein
MSRTRSFAGSIIISAALGALAACGGSELGGTIALPLTTTTPDGTVYRLRDGHFQIGSTSGGLGVGVSTEDDPGAPLIHLDLDAGSYQAELFAGWRLERSEAGGPFAPAAAALVSSNPLAFGVVDGATTSVSFVFRVEGADVTLGGGVDLGIDVYAACDPVAQAGCAAGERCARESFADGTSRTTCGPAGTLPEGTACTVPAVGFDDCVAGTTCINSTCRATCEIGTPTCTCFGGAFDDVPEAGACFPSCDPLAQDCAGTQACYFTPSGAVCAGAGTGVQGDACMFLNSCVEGSICSPGAGPGGGAGCAFICSLSGSGPTCGGPGGPGASFTCTSVGLPALPDVGVCR